LRASAPARDHHNQERQLTHSLERLSGTSVQLACLSDGDVFVHQISNDVEWLARHWQGQFELVCPRCDRSHTYPTKASFLGGAINTDRPANDILSGPNT
jgi:hypothetical protein